MAEIDEYGQVVTYADDDWFDQQAPGGLAPGQTDPYAGGFSEAPGGVFPDPTPAPSGPTGGGGTPSGYTGNPKADFLRLVQGLPATPASIAKVFPTFASWYPGSSYEKGDIKGPWGWADVIGGLDDPSKTAKWQWYTGSGGGGAGAGGRFGVDIPTGTLPSGNLTSLAAMALEKSPGYQFRLNEGMKALERSAASRGTLLTGGTLKGIEKYAQDYASGEYANQYARLFGEAQERFNQQLGRANVQLGVGNLGLGYGNLGLGYANLGETQRQNQANNLFRLSDYGFGGAQAAANQGSSYGNQILANILAQGGTGSELLSQWVNSNAAQRTAGAGQGWQAAGGGLNTALLLYLLNQR